MIKAEELSKGLISKNSNARKTQATTIMRLICGLRNFKNGELDLDAKESLAIVEAISILEKGAQILKKTAKLRLEDEQRRAKRRAEVEKAVNASFFAKLNTVGEHIAFLSLIDFHKIAWFDGDRQSELYIYRDCHKECLKSMIDSIAYRPEPAVEQLDIAWSTFQEKLPSLKQKHSGLIFRITELLEQDRARRQETVNRICPAEISLLFFFPCTAARHTVTELFLVTAGSPKDHVEHFSQPGWGPAAPSRPRGPVRASALPFHILETLEITMQASNGQREYFNLHTNGVGYLSRVRWITPQGRGRKSEPFLACAISALRGSSDSSDTTYFDLRVSGAEAIGLIDSMKQSVDERRKVTVIFRIADTYPHVYERDVRDQQTGRPTGQKEMAALIKGRLILIYSISVDGESVYKRSSDGAEPAGEDAPREHEPQGEGFYQDESWPEDQQQQQPRQAPQHAPQQEAPRGAQQQRPENAQRAGTASHGYAQPRQAAAPAARGHGPSAYARRPAPHSGAGYREPAGQR